MALQHLTSMLSLTPLALLCGLAAIILNYAYTFLTNPHRSIPGPFYSKFTRLPLKLAIITGNRMHYIHSLHLAYGPLVLIAPDEISTTSPADFAQMHRVSSGFAKTPWYENFVSFDRNVLFTMREKEEHARRRKMFARAFSAAHLEEYWEGSVHEHVRLGVRRMGEEAAGREGRERGVVDVLKWWMFMATDISATVLFGESFHVMEKGEINEYMHSLQLVTKGAGISVELPWVRTIGRYIPTDTFRYMFGANDVILEHGLLAVRNSRAVGGSKNIFANMHAQAEKDETLEDRDIQIESSALIIAGTDTTAVSLTYLVYMVLRHPEWKAKLVQELQTVPEGFRDRDLAQLPILEAIISETLRLHGAAPGSLPRAVPAGGATLSGKYIAEGTTVSTQAHSLHRDADLFPDPHKFDPARWLDSDALSKAARTVYSPFGAGRHVCLGMHLARMEMRLATVEFFRAYPGARLAASTTEESMMMENFFLIAPKAHRCEIVLGGRV